MDWNLLPIFAAVMTEGSVTAAAQRLHLSQGAVSAAVGRLRSTFNDPLFVRTRTGMAPTRRAEGVWTRLEPVLLGVCQIATNVDDFDPTTGEHRFTIGLSDDLELFLAPRLLQTLHTHFPTVSIGFRQSNAHVMGQLLDSGDIDLGIGARPRSRGRSIAVRELMTATYSCLYDPAAVALAGPLTQEAYLAAGHILISYDGVRGAVDDALKPHGLHRRIVASTRHFATVPLLLTSIPAVATMPTHAAQALAASSGLRCVPAPIPMPVETLYLGHRTTDAFHPPLEWIGNLIETLCTTADPARDGFAPG